MIENAHAGIWVRRNDADCQTVEGTGGGIVRARDSEIRNCYVGVEFAPYPNVSLRQVNPPTNQSYFNNMTFVQTRPLNNDILFKGHVILNSVYKIPFRGCRFGDEVPDNSEHASYYPNGWKDMGIGIDARSSTFEVTHKCDGTIGMNGECSGDWLESEFEILRYGIKATDGVGVHTFSVGHSTFSRNVYGIYGSGMELGPAILFNTFEVEAINPPLSAWKLTGVLLEETTGYEVEENLFKGYTFQNSSHEAVGVALVHTGPVANEIYRNVFSDLTVGAHAQGVNGGLDENLDPLPGLQFYCNRFGTLANESSLDNSLADIQLANNSSINRLQGAATDGKVAGNTFSQLCPGGDPSDLVLGLDAEPFKYYYNPAVPQTPQCYTSDIEIEAISGTGNLCTSSPSPTLTKTQVATVKSTLSPILDDVVDLYNGLRDGGNPSGLIAFINNPNNSSIEVRNEMMKCGPYISLAAWQAAFTRTPALDPWHVAQVLFLNSPLHADVKRMMNYYNFDPYYYELVLDGQSGGITHMQIMESDIASLTLEIQRAEQDYMRLAVLWEEDTIRWDEVMIFIGTDLHRQRLKAAIHLSRGEYTQANNVLGGLPQGHNKGGVLDILPAAEQADQFCPKFTTGQRDDLEYLADNEDAEGHSMARALLLQETGEEYDTELYFPTVQRSFAVQNQKKAKSSFMKVQPNPTKDLVYFSFRMPEGEVRAELTISDGTGKTVLNKEVSQSNGLVEWSAKGLGAGLYNCQLRFDGTVIETQTLSVVK